MTSAESTGPGSIRELSPDECLALLETTTVGRIAFVDDEGQQLVPVNFALLDGTIYFRTMADGFLSVLAKGHDDVAFGVDHHDVFQEGWNVTVRGSATGVEDQTTLDTVTAYHRLRPWAGGSRPLVIAVTPRHVAGRRVSGSR